MLINLIKKDLLLLKNSKAALVSVISILLVGFMVYNSAQDMAEAIGLTLMFHLYLVLLTFIATYMFFSIIVLQTSLKDSSSNAYLTAMPYSRKAQVTARYLVLALPSLICLAVLLLVSLLVKDISFNPLVCGGALGFILLTAGIMLLCSYIFGPERIQVLMMVLIFGTSMGSGKAVSLLSGTKLFTHVAASPLPFGLLLGGIGAAFYLVSLMVSIRKYQSEDL